MVPRSPYESLLATIPTARESVNAAGSETAYWVYGPEDAALTIVMVHGYRGDHHGLEPIVAQFPDARVIVPDLPGFGDSEAFAGRHDIANYAHWLAELLPLVGPSGIDVLLGHSFGSIVVAAAAADHPLNVGRIVLVNPIGAPALQGPRGIGTRLAVLYYWLGAHLPEQPGHALLSNRAIVRGMSATLAKTRDRRLRRWIHAQHDEYFSAFAHRRVVLEGFRASVSDDVSRYAERIDRPVLLVAATEDDLTPLSAQRALQRRFPNADLAVLDDVGHLVHYEKPAEAAEAVRRFLGDQDPLPPERMRRPLRILVDARYVRTEHPDGISRFTIGLVTALARMHPITVLISDRRQLDVLPDVPWVRGTSPTSVLEPTIALRVNRFRPDVVFTPMQTMGSLGRQYRLALTVHDLIYYSHPEPPRDLPGFVQVLWRIYHLAWWPQRLLLNRADAVVTVSQTTRDLIKRKRLTRRPIVVVRNAADELAGGPSPDREDGSAARSLVYMGSFMPYKNVATLVRAVQELDGYTLHLCSRVSAGARAELSALDSAGRVVFHDGVTDAEYEALLSSATALVSASRDEGFGIPLVEAMRLGIPVVVSDIPVFREIGGVAGRYAPADDPSAFAAAIRKLEDPDVWRGVSEVSIEQSRNFSWDSSARTLLRLLRELGAAPARR